MRAPVTAPAAGSGRIVLVIEGPVEVSDGSTSMTLVQGESVFGYPGDALTVTGAGGARNGDGGARRVI